MDIIQVTNPKFHPQTMRSIVVANARHEIQLANQMRMLGYHRRNFTVKDERERKWLTGRLAEMTTSMEASKAREEEERKERERRKASLYEMNELNVDRSAADENAIQVMKKLIQAAMQRPEPIQEDRMAERPQAESPTGDGSATVKSPASTARRSAKLRSLHAVLPARCSFPRLSLQTSCGPSRQFFQTRCSVPRPPLQTSCGLSRQFFQRRCSVPRPPLQTSCGPSRQFFQRRCSLPRPPLQTSCGLSRQFFQRRCSVSRPPL